LFPPWFCPSSLRSWSPAADCNDFFINQSYSVTLSSFECPIDPATFQSLFACIACSSSNYLSVLF
jgi:hypothetical protein